MTNSIAIIEVTYTNYTERETVYAGQAKQIEAIKKQSDFVGMEVIEGELEMTAAEKRLVKAYWTKHVEKTNIESQLELWLNGELELYERETKKMRKRVNVLGEYLMDKSVSFTSAMFARLEGMGYSEMCMTYDEFVNG